MAPNTPRWWIGIAGLAVATLVFAACGGSDDDSADADDTSTSAPAEPTVVTGAGDITAVVEEYRALLGPDNGGAPGGQASGRRELTWDGVPDELSAPNALPPDFFNASEEPRARGAVLETRGDHVAVSANSANPAGVPVRFGDINPTYVDTFRAFSEEKLFSPVGSNVVNLRFNVPGTDTPAGVRGFGAVYTDVDSEDAADFEFFDADDESLGTYAVPVSEDGFSFLGVAFDDPIVARVRIVYGNAELGPDDDAQYDVAVMDDFIYGEPQPLDGGGAEGDGAVSAARTGTFVGRVSDTEALVAVIADGDEVAGYVCDGAGVSRWFGAEPIDADGTAALVDRDGAELGTVTFAPDATRGTVDLDGVSGSFTLDEATGAAGLYRAEAREGGELALEAGWIVLGDGTQTGAANLIDQDTVTVESAPRLDTSAPRVVVRDFGSLAADHLTAGVIDKLSF